MFAKIKKLLKNQNTIPSEQAVELKKKGDAYVREENYQQAVSCYQQAINISPQYPDALIGLGYALSEQGLMDNAAKYLQQVLSITPNNVDAHFMLGNIAHQKGDLQQAVVHYNKALQANPNFEFAYRKLCAIYQTLGNISSAKNILERGIAAIPSSTSLLFDCAGLYFSEKDYPNAIRLLQNILKLSPSLLAAHTNIANAYLHTNQFEAAISHLEKITQLTPNDAVAYENLANTYLKLERKEQALQAFKEVLRIDPNSPFQHLVNAFSGQTTATATAGYVENLFDSYAESFESHLTQKLHYNTPSLLVSLIHTNLDLKNNKLIILDLGCGTGLFGKAIAPFANKIIGVDLSIKMLEKAKELNLYHRLEHQEVLAMMRQEPDSSYDLIAACDVFVYVGMLDEIVIEAKRLLRPNGIFAFSTESLEAQAQSDIKNDMQNFVLNTTGRYAHALSYLNNLANDTDFDVLETKEDVIRFNDQKPVQGYLSVWRNSQDVNK